MAERRMFAKTIIDSDAFLEMPMSTQALYFHLSMRADDDGFLNNPKKIQRMVGATEDDLKLLIAKNFIIVFDTGVIVIKHWKIHNYIRNDRYKPTVYQEEFKKLDLKDNGSYTLGIPNGYQMETQVRLGKDSIGKVNNKEGKKFVKPTIEEIEAYCKERNNGINANAFYDFYEAKDWFIGKNKMRDFKACIRTWEQRNKKDLPTWINKEETKQEMTLEEKQELEELLKDFK